MLFLNLNLKFLNYKNHLLYNVFTDSEECLLDKFRSLAISVTREKLYEEMWAEPNTKVSKRYGVSDSYLVHILKSLNIPRPPRGYWAMVAADIHPEKPPLPAAKLGDAITWSRDGQTEFATSTSDEGKSTSSKRTAQTATHGLVREAHEHFKNVRDSRSTYLKPYKKLTIDLIVAKETFQISDRKARWYINIYSNNNLLRQI